MLVKNDPGGKNPGPFFAKKGKNEYNFERERDRRI